MGSRKVRFRLKQKARATFLEKLTGQSRHLAVSGELIREIVENPYMNEWFGDCERRLSREVTIQGMRSGVIGSSKRIRVTLSVIHESPESCKLDSEIPLHEFGQYGYQGRWTWNRLCESGICTWRQLFALTDRDLLKIRNFGKGSLETIEKVLWQHGWTLVYPEH